MGLSPWEMLTFLPNIGFVMSGVAMAVVGGPFRGKEQAKTMGEYVQRNLVRGVLGWFSVGQLQAILPSFEQSYRAQYKKRNLEADVVEVPNTDIKGFWIGDKSKASMYMVYYHGGGFVLPGLDPHIEMLLRMVDKWSDGKLAVFCPCYTLSPHARYPQAIKECAEALRFVDGMGKGVLIGGDSAGGNLVVAMLSLFAGHHCAGVPELKLKKALVGAMAIAPWVSSDEEKFPEMVRLSGMDCITYKSAQYWIGLYKEVNGKDDEFVVPELADGAWWEGVKGKVGSILVMCGDCEVLRDPIKSWEGKFEKGFGKENLKFVIGEGEIHDHPLTPKTEQELAVVGAGESQEGALMRWVKEMMK